MLRASAASTTEQRSTPWINWCGPDPIEDGGARAMTHPDALPVAAEIAVGARRGIPAGALPTKFKDRVPVPSVVRPRAAGAGRRRLQIHMRPARIRLHSELPPTDVWAYEGTLPGPTIEVWRGVRVQIEWVNAI